MQFLTVLSLLAATAVAGPLHKVRQAGDSSGTCGGVPYSSGTWTCFENKVLCPIQNGKQFQHCNSQCYDPSIWSCNGGQLAPVGTATPGTPLGTPVATPYATPYATPQLNFGGFGTPAAAGTPPVGTPPAGTPPAGFGTPGAFTPGAFPTPTPGAAAGPGAF
ncbi:hypothetical protein HDK77DRAFT_479930 [Phyllosticta capitalensis]|uniref:Endo-1,3(4)-beta-glucanase 1 carbohydrate binding domain-containing protein n=1 Tax=Phyllosticta capitalensis TaxID=121624 RepID=A0ABR1YSB9_9PEZI